MATLWTLALVAAAALAYWIRFTVRKSSGKAAKSRLRSAVLAEQAEQDRLDCLEMERMLTGSAVADRDAVARKPATARRT